MIYMPSREIVIPEGVKVEISGNVLKFSGEKGQLEKKFKLPKDMKIEKTDNKIIITSASDRRKSLAMLGTIAAHIRNAIQGVTKGFVYKLRICFSHFPINVKVEGDKVVIQNFLGERKPRYAKIFGNTQVKVEGSEITVSGIDIDDVSQTAGSIERATRIVGYDRRRFQDGIYIVSKGE
jgi:large subunit ribosomal protein L6